MKKIVALFACICMFVTCFCGVSLADVMLDTSSNEGIDVVVVLDMTNSMGDPSDTIGERNDPDSYRIDATAMLIGMLDMDGSRVAIVPFASEPFVPGSLEGIMDLRSVNDEEVRNTLVEKLYSLMGRNRPNTNIGAALMKANQILKERDDKSNRPMIVLLTDGQNSISDSIIINHSLRWENGEIVDKGEQKYNTELADIVTREAVNCAAENEIPIYTVALTQDPYTASKSGISLYEISQATGLENGCRSVDKSNVNTLPKFFAEVLADKIGSSVQYSVKPQPVPGEADTYEVRIPILNKSILETNIILPVGNRQYKFSKMIDANSIKILDASGKVQGFYNGVSKLTNVNGHFATIKIREPQSIGVWTIQFTSKEDPSEIAFNILYNYNIKLSGELKTPGDNVIYKNDKLTLTANFVDIEGKPSLDTDLYIDHTGEEDYEDWMTIRSKWELYHLDANGNIFGAPIMNGDMTSDTFRMLFESDIELKDAMPSAGDYMIMISASGAGLNRQVLIPLTITNRTSAYSEYSYGIDVNSATEGKQETWTVEGTSGVLPKKADEIVVDPDGDKLDFMLRAEDGADKVALLTLNEDNTISYTTIQNGDHLACGTARYTLYFDDNDDGKGNVSVTLNVNSDVDAMLASYDPEMTITGTNVDGSDSEFKKNTPVTVSLRLKEKENPGYADGSLIDLLAKEIKIVDVATGEDYGKNGSPTLNGDAIEYTVETTGNKSAEWLVTGILGPFDPLEKTITVANQNAPEVIVPMDGITIRCDGDKLPDFLSGLFGNNTAEDDPILNVSPADYFTDKDGDVLEYTVPTFTDQNGEEMDPEVIRAYEVGDLQYKINAVGTPTNLFSYTYTARMTVTATDGDGESADYVQDITVEDLYYKFLTYLVIAGIIIAALVILFLIIHQIRKPVFPKLCMIIREEPSLYDSGSSELSPVKTYTNVNACGVDSDMAAKHDISVEQLQDIIIKPIRSTTSIGVVCKKILANHEISLGDVTIKQKKQYTWKIGEELAVVNNRGEGYVAVRLESAQNDVADVQEFGTDDGWTSVDNELENANVGGKKRSRVVKRKAASEPVEDFKSSNDDFDF